MIGRPVFVFFKSAGLLLGGDDHAAAAAARLQPHGKLLLVILFFIIPVPHPNASQQVSLRFFIQTTIFERSSKMLAYIIRRIDF
jgi:hypothetical protein